MPPACWIALVTGTVILDFVFGEHAVGDVNVLRRMLTRSKNVSRIQRRYLRIVLRHGKVFVEVNGITLKIEARLAMQTDQLAIQSYGRRTGCQAEHGRQAGGNCFAESGSR